jgi:hypothetical protein
VLTQLALPPSLPPLLSSEQNHKCGQVVKNVASQSLEVKKLVYLYLLHYADK